MFRLASKINVGKTSRRDWYGEAHARSDTRDGSSNIFISPYVSDSYLIGDVLIHELVHIVVGVEHDHDAVFKTCADRIGLIGKLTSTSAGPDLMPRLRTMIDELGPYPYSPLIKRPPDDPSPAEDKVTPSTGLPPDPDTATPAPPPPPPKPPRPALRSAPVRRRSPGAKKPRVPESTLLPPVTERPAHLQARAASPLGDEPSASEPAEGEPVAAAASDAIIIDGSGVARTPPAPAAPDALVVLRYRTQHDPDRDEELTFPSPADAQEWLASYIRDAWDDDESMPRDVVRQYSERFGLTWSITYTASDKVFDSYPAPTKES
jgi:hypothetical protein